MLKKLAIFFVFAILDASWKKIINGVEMEKKFMGKKIFESRVLPDGHLYCPEELARGKNAHFIVIATFEDANVEASERVVELSAIHDTSEDYLSEEELNYYLNLKQL
ncbi:MAG TPA: hypothetical protein VJ440_01710 [Candidatus Brocadiaceae bacterium]|nr:hypothetical protein [Candidatus Brocadiaceae bacterium]